MNERKVSLLDIANYITSLSNILIIYIVHANGMSAVTKIKCANGVLSKNPIGVGTISMLLNKLLTVEDESAIEIVIRLNNNEYYHIASLKTGGYVDMVAGKHVYH